MAMRVPAIHGVRRESLFSPRALTKSSSSFLSATVSTFFVMMADTNRQLVSSDDEYQTQRPDLVLLGFL